MFTASQENSLLINDYDKKPPIDEVLLFGAQQLAPYQTTTNLIELNKNHYELNDNVFPFAKLGGAWFPDTQEGEFFTVNK